MSGHNDGTEVIRAVTANTECIWSRGQCYMLDLRGRRSWHPCLVTVRASVTAISDVCTVESLLVITKRPRLCANIVKQAMCFAPRTHELRTQRIVI